MTAARPIAFRRDKYGVPLSVDVADVRALPGFIQTDEPHINAFYELVFVASGRGELEIDGDGCDVAPGATFVTRPGQVRRWRLRTRLDAAVVLFEREFIDGFVADPAFLDHFLDDALAVRLGGESLARSRETLAQLAREVTQLRADSEHVLRAGLYQLLAWLRRGLPVHRAVPSELASRFQKLVEREFRAHQRVIDYARLLGVSTEHLSRVVQRDLNTSASAVIHDRILLEAKRMLLYSHAPVAAIADALAFADASYFVRFFKRAVGVTPRRYRMSHFGS